jgi:hypothetical protein
MNNCIDLDYKKFPPLLGISLILDEKILLFRSHDIKYPILSDRPSYFSTYSNAKDRNLSIFLPKREINLLDIRYVKNIFNEIILERLSNNPDIINDYLTIALSFGLVSLKEQIKLYKLRYPDYKNDDRYKSMKKFISKKLNINPIELHGIRIGETTNDSHSAIILKQIFGSSFDGVISPDFESPYHNKTNNIIPCEILLFNPIQIIYPLDKKIKNIIHKSVIEILHDHRIFPIATGMDMNNSVFYYQSQKGSCKKEDNTNRFLYIDQKNEYLEKMSHKKIEKIMKKSNKLKKLLNIDYDRFRKELDYRNNKKMQFEDYFPTVKVNKW